MEKLIESEPKPLLLPSPLKINVGAGPNKIPGYLSVDNEEECKPDILHDIIDKPLPFKDETVDEIVFFHCIEHIPKRYHPRLLIDFARVLKRNASLYISYPNFEVCARFWLEQKDANRPFWEKTIYGRQLHNSDYHVCAVTPDYLADMLLHYGFGDITSSPEDGQACNSITHARRISQTAVPYETLVGESNKGLEIELRG